MKTQRALASTPAAKPTLPFPVFPGGASLKPLQNSNGLLSRIWGWFKARQLAHSSDRRLRVAASASLGEKRFVALIQIDDQQFLVGGGSTNVVLLAQVNAKEQFGVMVKEHMSAPKPRPAKRATKNAVKPALKPVIRAASEARIQEARQARRN